MSFFYHYDELFSKHNLLRNPKSIKQITLIYFYVSKKHLKIINGLLISGPDRYKIQPLVHHKLISFDIDLFLCKFVNI